ncbi:phage tail tape measure protein [Enterococcus cecorum]|uniref:phage tail tape measure protein n=2 Tax=Enterococcus cecorum TaxID=44008 RepID=UPI001FAB91DC|nr:phage tail tape measure protein [Enterococcus cecorum]MCJ0552522.1 phage tail tape measure protein [Enterococcus cecorum]MCJ0557621.1 phage tail tape measure protein [Enterococcus cecorum]MCJ0561688.1 phage tail tape measure protein [Enterococcus cecorum]
MANMGTPLGQMIVELGLDSSKFGKGLQSAKNEVRMWEQATRASMNSAVASGNRLDGLKSKYDGLTNAMKAQQKVVDQLKTDYANSFDKNGEATKRTERLAGQLAQAEAKLQGYRGQINQTAADMARLQVETQGFTGWLNKSGDNLIKNGERLKTFGNGLSSIGTSMTVGVTAPIMAGTIAVTKAAIDWESAFTGVKKTVNEMVDANGNVTYSYAKLEGQLKNLATQLPATHQEIAQVAENAGQLGISTDHIVEFTKTMIDMGESTNLSADEASTALARLANITGMSQDKFSNLGSSIVFLGNNFATTEREITEMGLRLAGAGKQIGLSQGSIMGIAAALSSVGIEAEQGGSAFSKLMVSLQLAVEKGGESLESFASVAGMTSDKFAQLFKSKPEVALERFIKWLGESEKHGKSAIAVLDEMGITEVRLRDTLLRAANAGDLMTKAIEGGNKAFNENTALANEANKRYETTESKLKMLRNEAVNLGIQLGGPLVDALRDGLQAAKPWLKTLSDMADRFSKLEPEQQRSILKWIAMGAAAGPTLKILGSGVTTIGGLFKAFGTLEKGLVNLIAKQAEAKAAATGISTALTGVGTSASVASGAGGLAGFASILTGPVGLAIGGTVLALGAGYGAWKLWGEEAWNSAQRTKRWGSDVGQATDEALTKVSNSAQTASGQFTLLEQGISSNTDKAVANFAKMGTAIETEMTNRINALRDVVKGLPDDIKGAAEELMSDEIKRQEENLQIVKQNNEEIAQIRKRASEQNREISYFEAAEIKQLANSSARAYAESLGKSEKETKQILAAMTGNVKQASEEQAQSWLTTLAKQRQASKENYAQMRKNLEDELTNRKIDLNSKMAKGLFDLLEESAKTSTNTIEQQMAEILGKYPELANQIFLANGQIINANDAAGQAMIAQNKRMMESFKDLTTTAAQSAEKNAKAIELQGDRTNEYGKFWNDLVLDTKTGEIKTNAQEAINEAAQSEIGWNNMVYATKEANLSSNAKLMIAEAAIANGKWDKMAFRDQEMFVDSNLTFEMMKAVKAKCDWDNLSFEQKKAILYSNTPEMMAETLTNLGLWDKYEPQIKELKAKNYDFLQVISQSEEKIKSWGTLPVNIKELLAKNENLKMTIYESEEYFNRWNTLPSDEKLMLANNQDALFKILSSEQRMNEWNTLPIDIKQMYANNQDLLNKALQSEQSLNSYASNNPPQKQLTGNSNSVVSEANRGSDALNRFKGITPGSKTMTGIDNASAPAKEATRNVRAFGGSETITKRFNIVASISGMARSALSKLGIHFAKGTNYHLGGPAIVNDQPGPTYKELVIPKGGLPFIPEGRDVFLPNLPRGSKVLTARQTKRLFPHYAEGVGIPKNARIFNLLNDNSTTESNVVDFSNLAKLLDDNRNQNEQIIKLLNMLASKQWSISAQDIANKSYRFVDNLQNRDKLRADLVNGR